MRPLAALLLAGCASGQATVTPVDADTTTPLDGTIEGVVDARVDAKVTPPVDAPVDAPPDAPMVTPPDAYQCQTMMRQLLVNPVFDLTPSGTGWVQQNIDNAYPIITDQDGITEHSAPYKAWLGGFEAPVATVTDVLYQDVSVPAGTTQLRLTGYYAVGTQETGTSVYDTAQLGLTQTDGTPIETVLSLSNTTPASTWTPIDYTFTANLSGQTVRLRMTSTNDFSLVTNFFFDTLALTATYCQ
jgi:hypothetical protein